MRKPLFRTVGPQFPWRRQQRFQSSHHCRRRHHPNNVANHHLHHHHHPSLAEFRRPPWTTTTTTTRSVSSTCDTTVIQDTRFSSSSSSNKKNSDPNRTILGDPIIRRRALDFSSGHHPSSLTLSGWGSTPLTSMIVGGGRFQQSQSQQQHRSFTTADVDRTKAKGPYGSYTTEYNESIQDPINFWKKAAALIHWHEAPQTILRQPKEKDEPWRTEWFPDGKLNMAYNCLDVHVQNGRGTQDALIYDSPLTGVKERYTYQELLDEVSKLTNVLLQLGVEAGDRVVIYMPMIPQAVMAMLACSRMGAIHSVVFGGFAPKELATRITDCQPKVIVTASVGVEPNRIVPYHPLLDEALALVDHPTVQNTIIVQRDNVQRCELTGPNDLDFATLMAQQSTQHTAPAFPASHPHHILYTSGTTGIPKGVVRETGGWAVALKYAMGSFYNTHPGDVYWAASDIGWTVGHLSIYAPLLQGCTTVIYEGKPVGTPDAGAFWRMIQEYSVQTFFVAPTAFRAIKQADPNADFANQYDLSSLRTLFLAGEHSDPDTLRYCEHALQKYGEVKEPIDHWWQTELGGPAMGNAVGLGRIPARYGACTGPAPGYNVHILNEDNGQEITKPRELGSLALKLPLPPGTFTTLYNNDERFVKAYMTKFPGYYDTSDAAFMDEDGYIHIVGRVDDIINTAGHRLSTGAMEEILLGHDEVADCAVFPMKDVVKGEVPVGLVVVNTTSTMDETQLRKELIELVRQELGPVAAFKKVRAVPALPKTRSGKILRGTMSKIANGEEYTITPTIEDPNIFQNFLEANIRELVQNDTTIGGK